VILPDGGRAYLSKIFNDAWMDSYGFLERAEDKTSATSCTPRTPPARCRRSWS
jgi:cystathionine beta-synthase